LAFCVSLVDGRKKLTAENKFDSDFVEKSNKRVLFYITTLS
jgi:hypothetical protein